MKKKLLALLSIILFLISYYIEVKSEDTQEEAINEIKKSIDLIPYRGSFILIELQYSLNDLKLKDKDSLEAAFLGLPEEVRAKLQESKLHFYNEKKHKIHFIKKGSTFKLYTFGENGKDEEGSGDDETYDLE